MGSESVDTVTEVDWYSLFLMFACIAMHSGRYFLCLAITCEQDHGLILLSVDLEIFYLGQEPFFWVNDGSF